MPQAEAFIQSLPPEPRRDFRIAIKKLAAGKTAGLDLRALEGSLAGYMRLRVRSYRAVYKITADKKGPALIFVAAGSRSTVYDAFEKILSEQSHS